MPSFFIESFQVPPFLLPIFQAAGAAYGIPWQVLAAINEVETDYGRDLSVSSAGAEGWMQFLPSSWAQYGVDANGDGFEDPYNPADAIFAAARYLRAAGGAAQHPRGDLLLQPLAGLRELGDAPRPAAGRHTLGTARRDHRSDRGPLPDPRGGSLQRRLSRRQGARTGSSKTLVGTAIYAPAGSPVIATQDGEVVQLGESPTLGHFVALKDAYGNTYVYAELGDVSSVYPVLQPHVDSTVSSKIEHAGAPHEATPDRSCQRRRPAALADLRKRDGLGALARRRSGPGILAGARDEHPRPPHARPGEHAGHRGARSEGLHGRLERGLPPSAPPRLAGDRRDGAGPRRHRNGPSTTEASEPHIVFQIRPAGSSAPLIDPKPILDGWVALENSSVFHAKGENPFLATSPTVGQVLLESKQQLEPQVLHDKGIQLGSCGRQDVQDGQVDKRVLAMLEYLSVSGLRPTVGGLACSPATPAAQAANAGVGLERRGGEHHGDQRDARRRPSDPRERGRHGGAQAADAPGPLASRRRSSA